MGTDILVRAQVKRGEQWQDTSLPDQAWGWRNCSVFAALSGLRNDHGVPVISPPRGLPQDLLDAGEVDPAISDSRLTGTGWLLLSELQAYDWEAPAWQQMFDTFGERYSLHALTCHVREVVMPALAQKGPPDEVRIVFTFEC